MWLFGHLECLNLSIIDAMGQCCRNRKNMPKNREQKIDRQRKENREHKIGKREQRTEKPITEAPLIAIQIEHQDCANNMAP